MNRNFAIQLAFWVAIAPDGKSYFIIPPASLIYEVTYSIISQIDQQADYSLKAA